MKGIAKERAAAEAQKQAAEKEKALKLVAQKHLKGLKHMVVTGAQIATAARASKSEKDSKRAEAVLRYVLLC